VTFCLGSLDAYSIVVQALLDESLHLPSSFASFGIVLLLCQRLSDLDELGRALGFARSLEGSER